MNLQQSVVINSDAIDAAHTACIWFRQVDFHLIGMKFDEDSKRNDVFRLDAFGTLEIFPRQASLHNLELARKLLDSIQSPYITMRLKHLEASLSCLQREFPDPKVELEQYPTSPELAACVVDAAVSRGDIGSEGQSVLDLGCGTGMLTVAAAFMVEEDEIVWGVDCDDDALEIAKQNVELVEMEDCVRFAKAQVQMKPNPLQGQDQGRPNKRGGRHGGRKGGRGRGRGGRGSGGRVGSQPASLTKSRLIYGKEDGVPLEDNCVE